jgi:hypothetical protein
MGGALDSGLGHAAFQFVGGDKVAGLFDVFPFEQQGQVVRVLNAAENPATSLSVVTAPV